MAGFQVITYGRFWVFTEALIEQCGFGDTVELRVEQDRLIIAPDRSPRQGWKEAFAAAGSSDHDPPMLEASPANEFDDEEWTW